MWEELVEQPWYLGMAQSSSPASAIRSLWVYQIWWIWRSYPFTQNVQLLSYQSSPRGPRVKPLVIRSLQSFDDPRDCQSLGQHPFIFKKPTSCILDFVLEAWTLTDASSSLAIQFRTLFSRASKVTLDKQTLGGLFGRGSCQFCTAFSQISFQPKWIPHLIRTLMWGDVS